MSSTSPQRRPQSAPVRSDNLIQDPDPAPDQDLDPPPSPDAGQHPNGGANADRTAPDTTDSPSLVDQHKKKAAVLGAFQNAFASIATLPAIVGVTQTVVLSGGDLSRYVMVAGVSLLASFSLIATGKGLRSQLIAEGYSEWNASLQSYSLMFGGLAAMLFTLVYTRPA